MDSSQPGGLVMKENVHLNEPSDISNFHPKNDFNGKSVDDENESQPSTDLDNMLLKENSPPQLSPISPASGDERVELTEDCLETLEKIDNTSEVTSQRSLDSDTKAHEPFTLDLISNVKNGEMLDDTSELSSTHVSITKKEDGISQPSDEGSENIKTENVVGKDKLSVSEIVEIPSFEDDTTLDKMETSKSNVQAKLTGSLVEKKTDTSKEAPPPQLFEDITEDEESGEEAFENIELELDDLIDSSEPAKNVSSSSLKLESVITHKMDCVDIVKDDLAEVISKPSSPVIPDCSNDTNVDGNVYAVVNPSVNGPCSTGHVRKPKFTARKSGKPESVPLKINLHPIKNIIMTLTDLEKALDYPPKDVDSLKVVKASDHTPKPALPSETCVLEESSALRGMAGLKKKRRKNTYDFPGQRRKSKKLKSDGQESVGSSADSVSLSDGDIQEPEIKTEQDKDSESPKLEKPETALDILTKNAALGFLKKPKPSPPTQTPKSAATKSSKIKTVLEMLHERSRQKAESGDKVSATTTCTTVSVTSSSTTTTTTILVSPPPDKPILEGVKRKGTPRKRKEEVICLSDSEDTSEKHISLEGKRKRDVSEGLHSPQAKAKTSPNSNSPVVVMVTQHSVSPGFRSLLPRQTFAQAGTAHTGSTLSTLPFIPSLPAGAKPVAVASMPPNVTSVPLGSLPQPTVTFFAPVPSIGSSAVPGAFVNTNLVVAPPKPWSAKPSNRNLKHSQSSSQLLLPSSLSSSSFNAKSGKKLDTARNSSDSLRALLVGKPYSMASTPSPNIPNSSMLYRMVTTTSGTNFVPFSAQPLKLLQPASPQLTKSAAAPKSSYSLIKSHPSHMPNGVSCLTPPKTPESDGSSEVAVAASLGRPVSGQVEDSEVIPLCCCKINGASFSKLFSGVTYCQALDTVDNKVLGCFNKVTNSQLVRPGVKIPFMAVCEVHRKRLKLHQCCPGCGHFCSQGKFQQCCKEGKSSVHNFHKQCMFYRGGKYYCPHCGEETSQSEVELKLNDDKTEGGIVSPTKVLTKEINTIRKKTARLGSKNFIKSKSTNDELNEKSALVNNKTINLGLLPLGPDQQALSKLCRCVSEDRPKKYRTLQKDLFTPSMEGDLEKVFYLLVDGLDPNKRYEEHDDQTPLHAAATYGSLGVVFILAQFGAEIHAQDKTLRTPMMCAAENGHVHVVQFLIKSGAKVEDRGEDGMTSLHYAAKAGYLDVIKHILETEKLDVNVQDDGGWTPIIWATESQLADVVKYLLQHGGDPNKKDNEENTGLHWAAFSGSLEIAEMFIDMGCEIDAINEHGDRPLHIASRQDHYDIVVLLLARGADVDTKNNKSETPVECCLNKSGQVWMALKVNQQLRSFAARKLIHPERLIERDITMGREKNPIACVNAEDDEVCPTDYLYVTENVETSPLNVNYVITSLQSCRCKDDCSSMYCVCGHSSVKCWYDKMGRLIDEVNLLEPPLVFECNRACRCWMNCNNRVVQNGITCRLQMFKTNGRGWGVRTLMDIPKGTFVCEYIGELISDSEADRREDDSYLFDLDNKDGDTYCIDARKYGNVSRFINHLCEPNLIPVKVFVEHQDLRFPRICLFSSKEIKAYEELGFDYGEKFWIIKWKHFTCACKSQKCKYSSDTIKKTLADYKLRYPDEVVDT